MDVQSFRRFFRAIIAPSLGACAVVIFAASPIDACPKCRLGAAGGLQVDMPGDLPAGESHGPLHPFEIIGGVNFTTAYYHRGYLQEDQGVIAQPHLTLALKAYDKDGLSVTPYVGWWNSLHDQHTFNDGDNDLWYESEVLGGAVVQRGPLSLDVKYMLRSYPNGALSQIEELGAKLSFDFASLWRGENEPADFVLLGWIGVERELSDHNEPPVPAAATTSATPSTVNTAPLSRSSSLSRAPRVAQLKSSDISTSHAPIFHQPQPGVGGAGAESGFDTSTQGTAFDIGIEPSFQTRLGRLPLALSFPVVLGLGADDYYQETGGDNDPLGYVQAGVTATVPMPLPGGGKWFVSLSVSYLHLFADSVIFANYGDEDEVIGTIGVGFAY